MKVWIVYINGYGDNEIAGIYSSLDLANARVQEFERRGRIADWNVEIEVFDVDTNIPIYPETS